MTFALPMGRAGVRRRGLGDDPGVVEGSSGRASPGGSPMTLLRAAAAVVVASLTLAASLSVAVTAAAGEEATWSGLEQPIPSGSAWPVGLGNIGDIAFWAPNRER